ncbi:MAG TPA: hypothetical protein VMT36_08335, partial [Candidatus Saccharimonadia bacterium]|nr:hypothetical protein [Candidatus Saccharimonadia bacterium]
MTADDTSRLAEALSAATAFPDPAYRTALMALASSSSPPVELADALTANADFLVGTVEGGLSGSIAVPSRAMRRLVGALGESGSAPAQQVLLQHVEHPDQQMADAVLGALVTAGPLPVADRGTARTALRGEALRTMRMLTALAALQDIPAAQHVVRGLRDDVTRSRNRAIGLLGLLHDHVSMSRTISLLGAGGAERPLALETLEVTVGRSGFPLAL